MLQRNLKSGPLTVSTVQQFEFDDVHADRLEFRLNVSVGDLDNPKGSGLQTRSWTQQILL